MGKNLFQVNEWKHDNGNTYLFGDRDKIPDSYRAVRIPEYSLRSPKIDSSEIHTFWKQESKNVSYDVVLKGP